MTSFVAGLLGGALAGTVVACWLVPRLAYSALRQVTKIILAERQHAPAAVAGPFTGTPTTTSMSDLPTPTWKSRVVN